MTFKILFTRLRKKRSRADKRTAENEMNSAHEIRSGQIRGKTKVAVRQQESEEWPHRSGETLLSAASERIRSLWHESHVTNIWYGETALASGEPGQPRCPAEVTAGHLCRRVHMWPHRQTEHMKKSIRTCASTHGGVETQRRPDRRLKLLKIVELSGVTSTKDHV